MTNETTTTTTTMDFDPLPINFDDAQIVDTIPLPFFETEIKDAVLDVFGGNSHSPITRVLSWNSSILGHQQATTGHAKNYTRDRETRLKHHDDFENIEELKDTTSTSSSSSFGATQVSKWKTRYQELVEYKRQYGNCNVSKNWVPNQALAQWVKRQRHQYCQQRQGHHSTLTPMRQEALELLGFTWDLHDATWEERFHELEQFSLLHGHCRIPTSYPPSPGLAIWAKSQRRYFKIYCTHKAKATSTGKVDGKSTMMSDQRIMKLAKLGFVFSNRSSKGALEIFTNCVNGVLEDL